MRSRNCTGLRRQKKGPAPNCVPTDQQGTAAYGACPPNNSQERVMGFEPTTTTLAT